MLHRRGFLTGLASMLAAPAIVHAGNLMPIKAASVLTHGFGEDIGFVVDQADLDAITRRAWLPRLFVQVYQAPPLLQDLTEARGVAAS